MILIAVETVPAGSKPPAADDSMRVSMGGRCGFGASELLLTRASPMHVSEVRGPAIMPKLAKLVRRSSTLAEKPSPFFTRSAKAPSVRLHVFVSCCTSTSSAVRRGCWAWCCRSAKRSFVALIFSVSSTNFLSCRVKVALQSIQLSIEVFFQHSIWIRHRGFARLKFMMMGYRTRTIIALGDSLALLPWPLRVNLDVKDTVPLVSVIKHPRHHRKGQEFWGDVIKNKSLLA